MQSVYVRASQNEEEIETEKLSHLQVHTVSNVWGPNLHPIHQCVSSKLTAACQADAAHISQVPMPCPGAHTREEHYSLAKRTASAKALS